MTIEPDAAIGAIATAPAAPARQPLSMPAKLLYSVSSLGSEALIQSRAAWLLYFYAPPAGSGLKPLLPLGLIGALLAILRIVDSFDAALIGYWSDRTRCRLGRRLPFILVGAPLWAIFAVLIVFPPANGPLPLIAVYFALTTELYGLSATVAGTPYDALLPEIARTNRERLDVVGVRVYFGVAGAAIGLIASGLLVAHVGIQGMMIAVAALALATRYLGVIGVWRHVDRQSAPDTLSLRDGLRTTFRNRQFRAFLPTFVLFQTGLQMLTGVLPYYAGAVLRVDDVGRWVAILMAVAVVSVLLAVPVFARIARRRSKRAAYRLAMLLTGLAFPVLMIAGFIPGVPRLPQVLIAMALIGAPMAGVYLFPAALIADIVEHDAAYTGLRREGAYYGAQSFVEKMTSALTPLALASLLLLGNSADHPLGIRLVGPVAALFVLIGLFLFRSYDLEDDVSNLSPAAAPDSATPHANAPTAHAAPSPRRFRNTLWSRLQARFGRRVVLLLARWVFRLRLEISGLEHVPPGEPLIVAGAPHRNWIDAFLIMMALPPNPRLYFLGSAEGMFNTWWKRAVLALFGGVVPVSTKGLLNREGLETSLAILAADNRLGIFPEGWEHISGPPDEVEPVKRGVAFLSQRSGRRVLPVGLAGSKSLWRGKTLRLRVGAPLDALAPDADRAEAQAFADHLRATQAALLPPLAPEPAPADRHWTWLTQMLD